MHTNIWLVVVWSAYLIGYLAVWWSYLATRRSENKLAAENAGLRLAQERGIACLRAFEAENRKRAIRLYEVAAVCEAEKPKQIKSAASSPVRFGHT